MFETFTALLIAHVLADFVLQFNWIVKHKRKAHAFAAHLVIVAGASAAALGLWPENQVSAGAAVLIVVGFHGLLDAVKTFTSAPAWLKGRSDWRAESFLLDQAGHVASLMVAAALFPAAYAQGVWAASTPEEGVLVLQAGAVLAGFLVATRAGQFLMAGFMARFSLPESKEAGGRNAELTNGGAWIGLLERALTFALVLAGRFEAIGFLIAAKSVLRFNYAAQDRAHSEYVIIGTLASFGWALVSAVATLSLLHAL